MKIVKENIDQLNAVLRLTVEKEDYEAQVEKKLASHRKTASFKGFRAGKVPMSLIKKMYGKGVMAELVNATISDNLYKYIREEKLNVIGEPLSNESLQKEIDFDTDTEFEFVFDLGLAPEISINFEESNAFPYYTIKADETLISEQIENIAYQYGEQKNTEIAVADDLVYCEIAEIDDAGNEVEGGLKVDRAPVSVKTIKDDQIQAQFLGANISQVLNFDVTKAFTNNADLAALFAVEQSSLDEKVKSKKFNFTIKEILHFAKAEINQNLFDKAFGPDVVKTEEEFKAKIEEQIATQFKKDSNFRFQVDAKDQLIAETDINLPDEFLKRWIKRKDEKITDEILAAEYDAFARSFRWELIRNSVVKAGELKVEDADMKLSAIEITRSQFAQYGMGNLPDQQYEQYSKAILEDEKQRQRIWEIAIESKVFEYIQSKVKLDEKEISVEDFKKLYEN